MQEHRKCLDCGTSFKPIRDNHAFCSARCAKRARQTVVCADCGAKRRSTRGKDKRPKYCRECELRRRHPSFPVEIPGLIPVYDKQGACDFARVDFDDWERFKDLRLFATNIAPGYPTFHGPESRPIHLHRAILGTMDREPQKQTDHISRDTFDNRKANLRSVTPKENCANRGYFYTDAA